MKNSNGKKFFLAFLLYFIVFAAFINFFHTDSILDKQPDCPACQFQQSNIALVFVLLQLLIIFICLHLLTTAETELVTFSLPSHIFSRAPPTYFS